MYNSANQFQQKQIVQKIHLLTKNNNKEKTEWTTEM